MASGIDPAYLAQKIHEDEECVVSAVEQLKYFDQIKLFDKEIDNLNNFLQIALDRRTEAQANMEAASARAQSAIKRVIDSINQP